MGRLAPIGRAARMPAIALGTAGMAIYGLGKGLAERDLSDPFYQMTLGDPKADREVLGAEVSPFALINPYSAISAVTGRNPITGATSFGSGFGTTAPVSALAFGSAGGAAAALMSRKKDILASVRGRRILKASLAGAAFGIGSALATSDTASRISAARASGLINQKNIAASTYAARYNNEMPRVDGSIAFGLYNSRQGG